MATNRKSTLNFKIFFAVSLLMMSSCGLKQVFETQDNLLEGSWVLDKVTCHDLDDQTIVLEEYLIPSSEEIILEFGATTFSYSIQLSSPCNSSATGGFSTNFDGDGSDNIKFLNPLSSGSCSLSIADSVGASSLQSVPLSLIAAKVDSLDWTVNSDGLFLEVLNDYKGSSTSCLSNCKCYLNLSEN